MKKLLVLIFPLLFYYQLTAQKISLGPEIGLNLFKIEDTNLGSNYQLGYFFGMGINNKFSDNFSLSSGIFLSQKKKQYSFIDTTKTPDPFASLLPIFTGGGIPGANVSSEASVYTTTNIRLSELYLQIPVLANLTFSNFSFFSGPYVSFLVSVKQNIVKTTESTATDISTFLPDEYNAFSSFLQPNKNNEPTITSSNSKDGLTSFDIGVTSGLGYKFNNLRLNACFSYGFMDFQKEKNNPINNHQIFTLSLAYLFDLKTTEKLKNKYDLDVK
ncbi:MAG: outer membrane beta-barrel protein [Flavobacteriales bacterium]|nr:outer membrane beta-barrel protein [Flavobacteriales bacterium]